MLEVLNTLLWGPGTLALILGTGVWLTLRTGGFPQRNLGRALTLSLGREARRKGRGGVSPFGSLMTALASTVGTGNIVGVAAALVSGGPGALVWMELAALLGLAAKFAECMLAVKYCRVRRDGTRWGGPMAVMEARLGAPGRWMGKLFAVFALLMAFTMGALAQSGALADTFSAAFTLPRWRVGLVTAALALTILLGGIRRIADISTVLVPVMALLYLGGGLAVILGNLRRLPEAVTLRAFETVLGPLAPWLIGVALGLFAFTSVLGCAVQAETTASYLLGPEAVRPCRVLYGLAVFAGAVIPMAAVLQLADLANALMAFPNLVCLLLLSDEIAGEGRRKDR